MRISVLIGLCLLSSNLLAAEVQPAAVTSVGLVLPAQAGPVVENTGKVFTRQVQQRCEAKVVLSGKAPLTVELAVERSIGAEGYRIEDRQGGGVRIAGNDERGVLYGVGKFLRNSRFDQGGFTPGAWRGTSAPKCPVRAIYMATHFMNYYEAAPLEELNHYIEDLGLWGYNTILIHFPTWQFNGLADPAARKWLDRFKMVLSQAHKNGLQVGLLQVPGEGYKNAPLEFIATKVPGNHRGNFGVNLCISKPEVRAHLREIHDAILDQFKDVGLDYFCFWPYDEGGCACKDCWPWGARGYLSISMEMVPRIRSRFPSSKIILSTWCFENENDNNPDGEWVGLAKAMAEDKNWADYIMADGHNDYFPKYLLETGVPGQLGLLNFPEISMFGMSPWGGYGANPAPAHFEKLWGRIKKKANGGAPYSEGVFEDINKAIYAQFYWNPDCRAEDTVKEYAAFEFSPDSADNLLEVVRIFEENHNRRKIGESAMRAFELVRMTDATLTAQARTSWRWRIIYLRALIDMELFERKGKLEGETLKASFEELTRIYHAENAHSMPIKPPQSAVATDGRAVPDQNVKLHKFSLGSITGEGWLKEDVGRLTKGMGGWGQGLVDPFWEKNATDWDSEFACKTLLGQVLLGWVSGDAAIQNLATSNINRIVSSPFKGADGYIGFSRPDIRKQDYLGWPANQEIRALLLYYEANPSRTDVRDAARDYALWFATNWNRSDYGDKANGLRFEPARPGHGYVGLCVVDAVLEVFKYYPQDKALLDWAKDYQDWYNTSSSFDHTKVDGMRSATYWPKIHAGAIGLTLKVPGLLSCYDPSLGSYREATLNALQRIMDLSATPAGGIDDKGEQLTRFNSPCGDMEYCNFQCYQEDLLVAGAISGQAKWFDCVEKMIYNAAKGATKKDWGAIGYMSRVNQYASESHFQEYKWKHGPPCCSCSAVISLPLFVDHMMMHDSVGNIFLTTYGPCQLQTDETPLLSETTDYPFDKDITVKFAKAFDKGIGIKIPTWCADGRISVRINGATQDIKSVPGTFEIVQKAGGFVAGDTISIVFDGMKGIQVRRHAQMPNYVWIERGPLVFACDVPMRWTQYPLEAHYGYKLAPKDGLAELEKGYRIDCSDLDLKSAAQVLTYEPSGYVWENPSVRIRIGVKSSMDGGAEKAIDLVPYGCTALRKTCFETTAGIMDDKKAK